MNNPLLGAGYEVNPDTGEWVNSEFRRISDVIFDYSQQPGSPDLFLAWIRPADRETAEDFTHPYAVVQRFPDGNTAVVFTLGEDELDHRVIARIFAGDQSKTDVFAYLAKEKAAKEALDLKRKMDQIEDMKDIARTVLHSNKHRFQHNGVRYD